MVAKLLLLLIIVLICYVFIRYLGELHIIDKETDKKIGKEEILQYITKTFGKGNFHIFKSMLDEDGKLKHIVYLADYEWFKAPKYQWFEVSAASNGYFHNEVEESYIYHKS